MFTGKKILVTGAASGIGKATVKYLSERGASIVGVDINSEGLAVLKSDLLGKLFIGVPANLTDPNLEYVFIEATADGVKLDGLVHCAGISGVIPLTALSVERLHKVMSINFYSFVELTRQYAKKKYAGNGPVVGISSLAAELPRAYELAYISSKAAMNAAIPCMAIELADKGIRVNGIMPGVVDTGMITEHQSDEQRTFNESMIKKTLLGAAKPEDISAVIAFLLGEESRMITGRVIASDGGMFL